MEFFTSDLHVFHNREFIYGNPTVGGRGFNSIEEMNEAIINNWRSVITDADDVYILGDIMLDPSHEDEAIEIFNSLPGRKHLAKGNHDRGRRWEMYQEKLDIVEQAVAYDLTLPWFGSSGENKIPVYASHFITIPYSIESASKPIKGITLHGHTHSNKKFELGVPYIYNVALDAHDMKPVSWEEIREDVRNEFNKCAKMLK